MHKLVMYSLSKQKNLAFIRIWKRLQRQIEEKHKCDGAYDPVLKMRKAGLRALSLLHC